MTIFIVLHTIYKSQNDRDDSIPCCWRRNHCWSKSFMLIYQDARGLMQENHIYIFTFVVSCVLKRNNVKWVFFLILHLLLLFRLQFSANFQWKIFQISIDIILLSGIISLIKKRMIQSQNVFCCLLKILILIINSVVILYCLWFKKTKALNQFSFLQINN